VCDGCGGSFQAAYNSSSMNEFGANAMSSIIINAVEKFVGEANSPEEIIFLVDKCLLGQLRAILRALTGEKEENEQYFALLEWL
jgi:hypothetical protein